MGVGFLGEGGESIVREAAEAVRDRRGFAAEEGLDEVREMAESCADSEEEEDSQAEVESPSGFESVHQDPRQEPWLYSLSHLFIRRLFF